MIKPLFIKKSRSRSHPVIIPLYAIIVGLILSLLNGFGSKVRTTIATPLSFLASPIWKLGLVIDSSIYQAKRSLNYKIKLIAENENLKTRLIETESKLADREALYQENIELRTILGNTEHTGAKILATILRKPPTTLYDTLIIDAGLNNRIVNNAIVYRTGTNIPIGIITDITNQTANVSLFSTSGREIKILIGKNAIEATAVGQGGGMFLVSLPRNTQVNIGELIRYVNTATEQAIFFGTIGEISSDPVSPTQTILFNMPVNIAELKSVQIEIK